MYMCVVCLYVCSCMCVHVCVHPSKYVQCGMYGVLVCVFMNMCAVCDVHLCVYSVNVCKNTVYECGVHV